MNKQGDKNSKIQDSKLAPPPKNLPLYGREKPEFVSYVAWSNYEAALEQKRFLFGIRRRDRRRNTLVVGRPGMGKTKFIQAMVRQDLAHGYGACVIDFRGDLTSELIKDIPETRLGDVVILDPQDPELRLRFNPLANISESFVFPMIRIMESTLQGMYGNLWNPQLEHLTHTLFATILDSNEPSMYLAYDFLVDEDVRVETISSVTDESLIAFWRDEYPNWKNKHEADAILPLINILRSLVTHPSLKAIYQHGADPIPMESFIDEQKIVLIRLLPDRLGETASGFFASLIMARFMEFSQNRPSRDTQAIRKDYSFYLDEFPRLDSDLLHGLLNTSRATGLSFTLIMNSTLSITSDATQQLLARTDNFFCFRLFGEDASRLRSEMLPVFDSRDLQNLGPGQMYCRIVIDDELSVPFSAETLEVLPVPNSIDRSELVDHVHASYGLPESDIY